MKIPFLLLATLFYSFQLFSQTDKDLSIYYGAHFFMPSKGYAHSVGIQKNIFNTKFGTINAELSFLYGGSYGSTYFSTGGKEKYKEIPNKVFHATVGSNLEIPFGRRRDNKLSLGILSGFSRYLITIEDITQIGNVFTVRGYYQSRNRVLFGSSMRYIHSFEFKRCNISIIPNYNLYKTSIWTYSAGILISIEI